MQLAGKLALAALAAALVFQAGSLAGEKASVPPKPPPPQPGFKTATIQIQRTVTTRPAEPDDYLWMDTGYPAPCVVVEYVPPAAYWEALSAARAREAAARAAERAAAEQAAARQAAALRAYQAAAIEIRSQDVSAGWAAIQTERMASEKLDEANLKRLQGRDEEALETLKLIIERFGRTEAAGKAAQVLANEPRIAAIADFLAAESLDRDGRYQEAAARYAALITRYPESVQALKARLRLEAMKKDDAVAVVVREETRRSAAESCPGWLSMARNYLYNNRPDQAREQLQKVVTNFPDSDYAREARQILAELAASGATAPPPRGR